MLAPTEPDVRWGATEALIKIDSDDAAKTLQPHLGEETDLTRKLEIAGYVPLSTLRWQPHGWPRMTRGQDGSLCLSCVTLSFTTPRRFYPGARHGLLAHVTSADK